MRLADFHDTIIDGIKRIQEIKKERGLDRPDIGFEYVLGRDNLHEMQDVVHLASDLELCRVNFRPLNLVGIEEREDELLGGLTKEQYRQTLVDTNNLCKEKGMATNLDEIISLLPFYEERLLFILMRLRHPRARVLYVTSEPVPAEIVDYYLQLLVGVPASHARERLKMMCLYDSSPRPLTEKILERPRVMSRMREFIGDPGRGYLTCFNSSELERGLAVQLGIPLNGVDPDLLDWGTKSGSRRVFREAGVRLPEGFEGVQNRAQVVQRLIDLRELKPGLERAVIKLNDSFAVQSLAVQRELGLDPAKVNPHGGALALGHPLGATGTRLVLSVLYALRRRGGGLGLATVCVGGGQGTALVLAV